MGQDAPKKIAIIAVSSLLLVALVVGLLFVSHDGSDNKSKVKTSSSQKAITAICQTTDYKETCFKSLNGHNSSDPKELIQASMQATIDYIKATLHNTTALKQAQTDPRARAALDACGELGNRAIDDLNRSFSKFSQFDITNVDDILLELKTWISGAMTHQETCLDGFEKLHSDAGARMKDLLTISMQMTSNALAMVAEISTFLESMGVQGYQQTSSSSRRRRRLLFQEDLVVAEHGSWVDAEKRRLLAVEAAKIRPNIVVAKDGSGKFKTINEALHHIPKHSNKTFVLYIKEGIYAEQVQINTTYTHLMIIGDGPTKTRITGSLNFVDGVGTYQTATVAVQGDDFIARDIAFENSAGAAKLQAVALRASSDKSIYYNCHIEAYQDTLYTHAYRQFYKDCLISGTIDFIFGDSAAIFQGCTMLFRKPLDNQQNIITAQGRLDVRQPTALVLQNCTFKADAELQAVKNKIKSYLGRPWKEYSRTIIMESFLDDFIHPEGWMPWDKTFAFETLFYTEFNNRGPASPKAQRVKWPGVKEVPPNRIKRFTAAEFLDGNRWIPQHRVPYAAGFIFPVPKEDPNIKYSPISTEETKDLGSIAERKKKSDSNNSNNNKGNGGTPTHPPASPSPPSLTTTPTQTPATPIAASPSYTPQSSIAAPPTLAQQVPSGSVVSPSSLEVGVGSDASAPIGSWNIETGELIIDLSPAPAPAPTPSSDTSEPPSLSPALSPSATSPATTPVPTLSPMAASPSITPVLALSPLAASSAITPSRAPASSPQSSAPIMPSLSPKGNPTSTHLSNAVAPSPSGGLAPPPRKATTASPTGAPQFQLSPQTTQAPTLTGAL
ncbi:probable pectinesterase/pectinesterase inhibitor 58 [Salvia miltiorrhiza]|uniref:probable pectinesterase/pectinesterase inhibitor 58 n=1 Tax=Salvia miltiorrhiza TaxID=226208 RepID=UPI0025AD7729|nr:probable pectinesterase/pectinesterase inhibitor 58 [Salvia miltiorrhiza]